MQGRNVITIEKQIILVPVPLSNAASQTLTQIITTPKPLSLDGIRHIFRRAT
ncbi:MAG: hypothetical protein IJR85_03010 [Synergistaceae bacterium]|nr:hypothetical protein [Synergistaceae bacterium]